MAARWSCLELEVVDEEEMATVLPLCTTVRIFSVLICCFWRMLCLAEDSSLAGASLVDFWLQDEAEASGADVTDFFVCFVIWVSVVVLPLRRHCWVTVVTTVSTSRLLAVAPLVESSDSLPLLLPLLLLLLLESLESDWRLLRRGLSDQCCELAAKMAEAFNEAIRFGVTS